MDLQSAELIFPDEEEENTVGIINCLPWIIDACNETDYESFKLYTIAKADAELLLLLVVVRMLYQFGCCIRGKSPTVSRLFQYRSAL